MAYLGGKIVAEPPPGPDGSYAVGTRVVLTPKPVGAFKFIEWQGDASGSLARLEILLTGERTVRANFGGKEVEITGTKAAQVPGLQRNFKIKVAPSQGGVVMATPAKKFENSPGHEENVFATAVANPGFLFSH